MNLSVIIPAYNEEAYLTATLEHVKVALGAMSEVEIIVIDNESTDATSSIAEGFGVRMVTETMHNIAAVRNNGGENAAGSILVFIDADTWVFPGVFENILEAMSDEKCFGGSVAVQYGESTRKWIKYYLMGWQFWGRILKMRQGAAQFCRKGAFTDLGGYDKTIYMGEDIEFQWRLAKLARRQGGHTAFIEEPRVLTSARRYSKMGLLKMLVLTHPIIIFLAWRSSWIWKDWYKNAVR